MKFTWNPDRHSTQVQGILLVQVSPIWFHLEPEYALEARGMAIALPGELQESVGLGTNRALTAVYGRSVAGRPNS